MLTFQQFITELFDQPAKFRKDHKASVDGQNIYHFNVSGKKYSAHVLHDEDGERAHVAFAQGNKINTTNDSPREAHKVIGTVRHVVAQHLKKNPQIKTAQFCADNDEPGRVKLYRHLMKKTASKHLEYDDGEQTHFSFNTGELN